MGYDLSLTRAPIEPIQRVLAAMRAQGLHVIHTREGHRPDLADLPANKRWRSQRIGAGHRRSRARAAASWCAASRAGRSSPSSRRCRRADHRQARQGLVLRHRPRADAAARAASRNMVLTGITTDVCVHTTMREANDRGFECLLLEDCCGATDHGNHVAAHQDGQDAGRRVRRGRDSRGPSSEALPDDRRRSPSRRRALRRSQADRHDQALRRLHGARRRVAEGRAPARSTRCSARTAPARARSSSASWATTRPTRAACCVGGAEVAIAQSARRARARHRHGLPALHAGAGT